MKEPLDETQQLILKRLGTCLPSSGMVNEEVARLIGRQPGADSTRKHASYVSRLLRDMESKGLIERADDKKPILWRVKK